VSDDNHTDDPPETQERQVLNEILALVSVDANQLFWFLAHNRGATFLEIRDAAIAQEDDEYEWDDEIYPCTEEESEWICGILHELYVAGLIDDRIVTQYGWRGNSQNVKQYVPRQPTPRSIKRWRREFGAANDVKPMTVQSAGDYEPKKKRRGRKPRRQKTEVNNA
jgi:hypothetical protein